jgi:hypothetical protein
MLVLVLRVDEDRHYLEGSLVPFSIGAGLPTAKFKKYCAHRISARKLAEHECISRSIKNALAYLHMNICAKLDYCGLDLKATERPDCDEVRNPCKNYEVVSADLWPSNLFEYKWDKMRSHPGPRASTPNRHTSKQTMN